MRSAFLSIHASHVPACLLLAGLLTSCTPRFAIYQASSEEVALDGEGELSASDESLTFVYEYWSPGGAPWVSLRNESLADLHLDLRKSELRYAGVVMQLDGLRRRSLDGLTMQERFADLRITYSDGRPQLVLPKGEWVAFELPALAYGPCERSRSREHCATFHWVLTDDQGQSLKRAHQFTAAPITYLKRKELDDYAMREASNDLYFDDLRPNQSLDATNTTLTILDVLVSVLFLL